MRRNSGKPTWPLTSNVYSFTVYISGTNSKGGRILKFATFDLYRGRIGSWTKAVMDLLQSEKFAGLKVLKFRKGFRFNSLPVILP